MASRYNLFEGREEKLKLYSAGGVYNRRPIYVLDSLTSAGDIVSSSYYTDYESWGDDIFTALAQGCSFDCIKQCSGLDFDVRIEDSEDDLGLYTIWPDLITCYVTVCDGVDEC